MIAYTPFWKTLEKSPETWYTLVNTHHINPNTLSRMKHGKGINTRTLNDLCSIFDCRVEDILVYIPDKKEALMNKPDET